MRRLWGLLLAGALMTGLLAAPAAAGDDPSDLPTIGEIVIDVSSTDGPDNNGMDYDILLAAVLADPLLTDAVLGTGAFEGVDITVFAPNDRAFKRLTGTSSEADAAAALAPLLGGPVLQDIVLYHAVPGSLFSGDVFTDKKWKTNVLTMANGDPLYARMLRLVDGSGNRVFPKLDAVDIEASNGVIHTVKEVLTPRADASGTIADTVIAVSSLGGPDTNKYDFDLLLAAVLADPVLTSAVSGTDGFAGVDFTVFAPNDRAFMKLTGTSNEADAAAALAPLLGTPELQDIVLYHVVAGDAVSYGDTFGQAPWTAKYFTMANGDSLKARAFRLIDGTGNRVWPKVTGVDILATNGVIHTVYEVLLPPADAE